MIQWWIPCSGNALATYGQNLQLIPLVIVGMEQSFSGLNSLAYKIMIPRVWRTFLEMQLLSQDCCGPEASKRLADHNCSFSHQRFKQDLCVFFLQMLLKSPTVDQSVWFDQKGWEGEAQIKTCLAKRSSSFSKQWQSKLLSLESSHKVIHHTTWHVYSRSL